MTTSVPEPTSSQIRSTELLLFPLRTALVVAPIWLVYWMYSRFSLSDVSMLFDVAIWLSVALAVLSTIKTGISMRVSTDSVLLRDALRAVKFSAVFRKREFWSNPNESAVPHSQLRVLRRIELFVLTPMRLAVSIAMYLLVRNMAELITSEPTWLASLNSWSWSAVLVLYVIYLVCKAVMALASTDASNFVDAQRFQAWAKRLRR
ncbi:hypothetical protein G6M78_15725 [Agrobacterium tumefaciens]|uniref:hypothetical protein n=1 Tax=Agrobacterium tumefaciens TaxID=358 RepID=UPI001574D0A8|nr:hypothetical protein [Agrobacterium tumefaciens]MCZ7497312.1 hypothetical protein [Rhizobium rhizogenes]NTE56526.1 hypothetical protein [Agrobacterium tumefaciens]NTE74494.1 hypothetical protein [Agrobacterium tumefaciens]